MNLKRVFAYGAVLLLLALLTEVTLRVGLGLGSPPLLQADAEIGYLFQPEQSLHRFGNEVTINSFHQRTHEISAEPAGDVFRVLLIGDSVTFGGVLLDQRETLSERLRHKLTTTCADSVEVLNASAGSWGIGNAQAYLARFGTFGSRVVILQVGSHDLLQQTATGAVVDNHPSYPSRSPVLALQELWVRYLSPRLSSFLPNITGGANAEAVGERHVVQSENILTDDALFGQNMAYLRSAIRKIRAADAVVGILYTPDRNEVVSENGIYATTYAPYRARFIAMNDSLDVPVIDALTAWRGSAEAPSLFRDGVHPSKDGSRELSSITATWLNRELCLQ